MAKKKSLEDMVADLYDDDEIGNAVLSDADRLKNREKIEAGQLELPDPIDAAKWHARTTGLEQLTPTEKSQQDTIKALEARIAALEGGRKDNVQ